MIGPNESQHKNGYNTFESLPPALIGEASSLFQSSWLVPHAAEFRGEHQTNQCVCKRRFDPPLEGSSSNRLPTPLRHRMITQSGTKSSVSRPLCCTAGCQIPASSGANPAARKRGFGSSSGLPPPCPPTSPHKNSTSPLRGHLKGQAPVFASPPQGRDTLQVSRARRVSS